MKKIYFLFISAVVICTSAFSQNLLLNGSFESNTASSNTLGLTTMWQSTVANSWEVGSGTMDLITSNNCGTASDGKNRILDIIPETLHQRTPFYVGSKGMVEKAESFV